MDRMLYLRYVTPPRPLLLHAALYWDSLVSIAPPNYDLKDRDARSLLDHNVLELVELENLPFDENPLELAAKIEVVMDTVPESQLRPEPSFFHDPGSRLYMGKFPMTVEQALLDRGCLSRDSPWGENTYVANKFLLQLMLAVAGSETAEQMDRHDGRRTSIHVDRQATERLALGPLPGEMKRCWQLDVSDTLFQVPPSTPIQKVLELRERYEEERQELTTSLTKLVASLTVGGELPTKRTLAQEVQNACDQYEKAFSSRGVNRIPRPLYLLAGAGALMLPAAIPHVHGTEAAAIHAVSQVLSSCGIGLGMRATRVDGDGGFAYVHRAKSLAA